MGNRVKSIQLLILSSAFTALVTGCEGHSPSPVNKSNATNSSQPANQISIAQTQHTSPFTPVKTVIHGGLSNVTRDGRILYFEPENPNDRNFTWDSIGVWNPYTDKSSTLFAPQGNFTAGNARSDIQWSICKYYPRSDQKRGSEGQGWKLVAKNNQSKKTFVVARNVTGSLKGTKLPTNVGPYIALFGNEAVWTQFTGTKGHYKDTLNLMNLKTKKKHTIRQVNNAPTNSFGQLALYNSTLAYTRNQILYKPQPHAKSTLVVYNLAAKKIIQSVPSGSESIFSYNGKKIYFWSKPSSIGELSATGGTPKKVGMGSVPEWGPSAGKNFFVYYTEGMTPPLGVFTNGSPLHLPRQQINAVSAGGGTVAWSDLPQGNSSTPTIHAEIEDR